MKPRIALALSGGGFRASIFHLGVLRRLAELRWLSRKPQLVFRPDALRESGIPEALIEAAAQSNPQGLILFEDVPQFKGCDNQPTRFESTH